VLLNLEWPTDFNPASLVRRASRAAMVMLVVACCMVASIVPLARADEPAAFVGAQVLRGVPFHRGGAMLMGRLLRN
jgi:hypothetical protein